LLPREFEEIRDLLALVDVRPREAALREARERREPVVALAHDRDRDAVPAEAAHDAERAVVAAEHDGAARRGPGLRPRGLGDGGLGHRFLLDASTPRARERAAKSVPATKRISGPMLQAAGAPTMCRPGTDVW